VIGVFSDSHGDLEAFDAAYELLRSKGARRFLFTGARYTDLDEWVLWRRQKGRGGREYSDGDFLADVSSWLGNQDALPRTPARGEAPADLTSEDDRRLVMERFVRVPERESLQYRDPAINNKAMDLVGDTLCCIVHDKNDLNRDDLLNAQVFIHGKEPEPKVVQIGPRFFLTPGRLVGAAEQTCALLEKAERDLRFSAFRLDGHRVLEPQLLVVEKKSSKLTLK
jgi:predicted phosphodiesterase